MKFAVLALLVAAEATQVSVADLPTPIEGDDFVAL